MLHGWESRLSCNDLFIEPCRSSGSACLSYVVDFYEAKPRREPVGPFKIIEEAPVKVSNNRSSVSDGRRKVGEDCLE
jgi:hypothetical protein